MPLPVLPDSQLRLSEEAGGQEAALNCLLLAKAAEVWAVGLVDRVVVVAAEEVAADEEGDARKPARSDHLALRMSGRVCQRCTRAFSPRLHALGRRQSR